MAETKHTYFINPFFDINDIFLKWHNNYDELQAFFTKINKYPSIKFNFKI